MTNHCSYSSLRWVATLASFTSIALGVTQHFNHDIHWISRHLSGQTPYIPLGNPQELRAPAGYDLEQIQIIFRHGSRYPGDNVIDQIANAVAIVHHSTTPVSWIEGYDNVYTKENNYELDENGQAELYQLGRRISSAAPKLIEKMVDGDVIHDFSAMSSDTKRTTQSAQAFALGLFEGYGPLSGNHFAAAPLITLPHSGNFITNAVGSCPRWYEAYLYELTSTTTDSYSYLKKAGQPIADRLSRELGIPNLTPSDVFDIYLACSFDVSHRGWTETFCSLLSPQDILAMEFYHDLLDYHVFLYGSPVTGTACYLVKDIMENIDQAVVSGGTFNQTVVKATHDTTIAALETFFDLFKDEPFPTSHSTQFEIENRRFRASIALSFASNFVFQVLKATGGASDYSVRVLFAENPIIIPGCPNEICPLATFKSIVAPKLNCDSLKDKCRRV